MIVSTLSSGQRRRAAASAKAETPGRIDISSGATSRASVAPMPKHIGSPVASTQTRFPRIFGMRSTSGAIGEGQARRSIRRPFARRHHRQMPLAADQHLRGVDQRARDRRKAGKAVLADADDSEPGAHGLLPRISAFSAAAAIALPPRRPWSVMKARPRLFAASAAFNSAAPTKPTGKPNTSAGLSAPPAQARAAGRVQWVRCR